MTITLGFSPCPNDTFIFDALVNNKIDSGDLKFDVVLDDVETLNNYALQGKLDVTKISYGVLPDVLTKYIVLNAGSALGKGVGPLLISTKHLADDTLNNCTVAVPGKNTTAHLLFNLAYPHAKQKIFMRYDEIENFVLQSKEPAAGVIIHENRFTYAERGLHKLLDLGDYWQTQTGVPVPLGGIAGKKELSEVILKKIDQFIKESIEYAFKNNGALSKFVKDNAQEMSEEVMRKHIDLYVNDYSVSLGTEGKEAIVKLLEVYKTDHPFFSYNFEDTFLAENNSFKHFA